MLPEAKPLKEILVDRLEKMGIEGDLIPGFLRILANSLFVDVPVTLPGVNSRMRFLGWKDTDIDMHTLQLAIACFEAEGLNGPKNRHSRWFANRFPPSKAVACA